MNHLYEKLIEYSASDYYPYHMPGHKRRLCGEMPKQIIGMDITEIDGFDNLHQPEGILQELQEKAAIFYGAEESFYLVGGSTSGILSAVSAAVPERGHILMARNCHKSAYHAAYLRNLTISYLYPFVMEEYDINDVITPEQVRNALEQEPDIAAVLLVSPTYEGRIADVKQIAQIVHEKGIPLLVDEAHGAHLGWAEGFAENSCRLGADLVIHSVHKTLPAMTQTALLHVNGTFIDRDRLRRFLHIYQSSSPSYVLMASIDNAMHILEQNSRELFSDFRSRYNRMLESLSVCRHLQFLNPQDGKQDIGKLLISGKRFGLSGQEIYDILLKEYHLQLEMAAGSYALAMFTVGDCAEAYERITEALLDIDARMDRGILETDAVSSSLYNPNLENIHSEKAVQDSSVSMPNTELSVIERRNAGISKVELLDSEHSSPDKLTAIPLSIAWEMPWEWVPLHDAIGRRVGEFVNLYPPGTPLLVPGEVMTRELYHQIASSLRQQLNVQGIEQTDYMYRIKALRK